MYDIETSVLTFFHITEVRVNDIRAMDAIPYEENSFYIFDRSNNDFKRLHTIESIGLVSWLETRRTVTYGL